MAVSFGRRLSERVLLRDIYMSPWLAMVRIAVNNKNTETSQMRLCFPVQWTEGRCYWRCIHACRSLLVARYRNGLDNQDISSARGVIFSIADSSVLSPVSAR